MVKFIKSLVWVCKLQWRTSKVYCAWNIISNTMIGVLAIIVVYALSKLINVVSQIAGGEAINHYFVYFWLAVILLSTIFKRTLESVGWRVNDAFRRKTEVIVAETLIFKMYELSQQQFDDQRFNTKINRAQASIGSLQQTTHALAQSLSQTVTVAGSLVAICLISPWVALAIVVSTMPAIIINSKFNFEWEKLLKKNEPIERLANKSRQMLIDPRQMVEIRLLNAFQKIIHIWRQDKNKANDQVIASYWRFAKWEALLGLLSPVTEFISNIFLFHKLILSKEPNLGSFIFVRNLISGLMFSSSSLIDEMRRVHSNSIELQNLEDVYKTEPIIINGTMEVKPPLTIRFDKVSFRYPNTNKTVLEDISFKIEPGKHLALVGENGAGKTTILKLLMRQYLPISGKIEVNGVNLNDLEIGSYCRLISYLGQELFVAEQLTIRQNLLIDKNETIAEADIWRALKMTKADSFIEELDRGLEMRLAPSFENGTDLSFGQKQRICITRSLLRKVDLLVLDEPTSAIDAKAEHAIFNNIYSHQSNKSVLIISHRFSTVRKADEIIVLNTGKSLSRAITTHWCINRVFIKECSRFRLGVITDFLTKNIIAPADGLFSYPRTTYVCKKVVDIN